MSQSEQWQSSDIVEAALEPPPPKKRTRLTSEDISLPSDRPAAPVGDVISNDVGTRLEENSAKCVAAYRTWKNNKCAETEDLLTKTLHDIRKATAGMEIEIAASHAGESSLKPIPIPSHRSHVRGS